MNIEGTLNSKIKNYIITRENIMKHTYLVMMNATGQGGIFMQTLLL